MNRILLLAIAASLAAAGVALATPSSGVVSASVLNRATLDPFKLKLRDSSNAGDAIIQRTVFAPGGQTGWHTHPGPVLVLVKSGTLTLYDGDDPSCTPTTYGPGQAFAEKGYGEVRNARNEGDTNLEFHAVYLDVPVGQPVREDSVDPGNCSF